MSTIEKNLDELFNTLRSMNSSVDVVVATKYASLNDIKILADIKHPIIFGENRVQHGEEKQLAFPEISNPWHFIGHLQRNKVKKIINNYDLIHSVDSLRLMKEIHNQSLKQTKVTNVLLQINPLEESTKFGFNSETIYEAIEHSHNLPNISIQGLMTMAPHTENIKLIEKTFKTSRDLYDSIKIDGKRLKYLSMGMSNDYKIAINEGSTMIRIGSIIFK